MATIFTLPRQFSKYYSVKIVKIDMFLKSYNPVSVPTNIGEWISSLQNPVFFSQHGNQLFYITQNYSNVTLKI